MKEKSKTVVFFILLITCLFYCIIMQKKDGKDPSYINDWRINDLIQAMKEQGRKIDASCFEKKCVYVDQKTIYYYVCSKYYIGLPVLNDEEETIPCQMK